MGKVLQFLALQEAELNHQLDPSEDKAWSLIEENNRLG